MTPQRLELQEHLECDALLACAATRSRSRRNDVDEDTAAATARKKRRRNASGRVPEERGRYLLKCRSFGRRPRKRETKETTTPPTSARDKRARSTSAQPDERQPPAGPAKRARKESIGQFGPWPDIPPTWELELDVRGHTETKTKLLTRSVHASDSRIEASTPVDSLPLSSYENLVMWWSQPTQENKENASPSFCPCFKHLSGYFPGCWDWTRSVGPLEGALKPNIRNTVREEE